MVKAGPPVDFAEPAPRRELNLASIRRVVADSDRAAVENGR